MQAAQLFPFLRWRRLVTRETLKRDLLAGLTGAIVVLPQGVAFATIAGLPPQYGLYAGMVPAIVAALFGSSWHLVSGPTTAASVVLFSALSTLAQPGSSAYIQLALTLTFMGLSNIAGSFFSGYVATGSFNRSALNYESGARTPVSAIFAGALLMLVVLLVARLAVYLPKAAMAGMLFLVAWRLIDFHHIKRIIRTSRSETLVLVVTFTTVILVDLEFAILFGVLLSLLLYLMEATRPRLFSRVPNPALPRRKFTTDSSLPECPQLKIVRVDGSLFFGSIHHVTKLLRIFEQRHPQQKHLMLVAMGINSVDISGAEFLCQESRHRRNIGGDLYLCRLKEPVIAFLRRGGYLEELSENNVFGGKTEAVEKIFGRLDKDVCGRCDKRIFLECVRVPESKTSNRGDTGAALKEQG
jgi:SulP family sulfate permease